MGTKPGSAGGGGPAAQRRGRLRAPLTGLKMPRPTSEWARGSAESRCVRLDGGGLCAPGALAWTLLSGTEGRPPAVAPGSRDVPQPLAGPGSWCSWHGNPGEGSLLSVLSRPRVLQDKV